MQQMTRTLPTFAIAVCAVSLGCGGVEDVGSVKDTSATRVSQAQLEVCHNCEALLARERVFTSAGSLLQEVVVDTPRAPGFWDELGSGVATDGRKYVSASGATWNGIADVRFQYLALSDDQGPPSGATLKTDGLPAPQVAKVLSPKLAGLIAQKPSVLVHVFIDVLPSPQTSLAPHPSLQFAWLPESEKVKDAALRIATRQGEVATLVGPLLEALHASGAQDVETLWLTGNVFARMPAAFLPAIFGRSDVATVELVEALPPATANVWDGQDMKDAGGLNAGVYVNNGFDGDAYVPQTGEPIKVAIVDESFDYNHPALTNGGGYTRVYQRWNCVNNPCTYGTPYPPSGQHGSVLAGLAVGDLREGQMAGAPDWQLDRTGLAEESWVTLIDIGANGVGTARGIQKAVATFSDVIVLARGGTGSPCDGNSADIDEAVWQAHSAGRLVVSAAGNNGHAGAREPCTLGGGADNMAGFTVGSLGETQTSVTSANYGSSDVSSFSSRGGIDVTIGGSYYQGAVTGVSVLAPGCPNYKMVYDDAWFEGGACGTSYAAPQIGGAAALVEDWYLQTQGSFIVGGPGRHFAALLAMSDRANGPTSTRSVGFDKLWGGGRFQARLYAGADHVGVFGWMHTVVSIQNGQTQSVVVNGTGAEPSTLNQFKAYAVFFESDNADIADIDIYVRDQNCGTGSVELGRDQSRDTKSLVRLSGGQAAGKALCVQLYGYYVPPGQSREVNLFTYYSEATGGR